MFTVSSGRRDSGPKTSGYRRTKFHRPAAEGSNLNREIAITETEESFISNVLIRITA